MDKTVICQCGGHKTIVDGTVGDIVHDIVSARQQEEEFVAFGAGDSSHIDPEKVVSVHAYKPNLDR